MAIISAWLMKKGCNQSRQFKTNIEVAHDSSIQFRPAKLVGDVSNANFDWLNEIYVLSLDYTINGRECTRTVLLINLISVKIQMAANSN